MAGHGDAPPYLAPGVALPGFQYAFILRLTAFFAAAFMPVRLRVAAGRPRFIVAPAAVFANSALMASPRHVRCVHHDLTERRVVVFLSARHSCGGTQWLLWAIRLLDATFERHI